MKILDLTEVIRLRLEKKSCLRLISGEKLSVKKQETEAMGHCRMTPLTGYLAAALSTGKEPRLNPHKIIWLRGLFSQAKTISISFAMISSPT